MAAGKQGYRHGWRKRRRSRFPRRAAILLACGSIPARTPGGWAAVFGILSVTRMVTGGPKTGQQTAPSTTRRGSSAARAFDRGRPSSPAIPDRPRPYRRGRRPPTPRGTAAIFRASSLPTSDAASGKRASRFAIQHPCCPGRRDPSQSWTAKVLVGSSKIALAIIICGFAFIVFAFIVRLAVHEAGHRESNARALQETLRGGAPCDLGGRDAQEELNARAGQSRQIRPGDGDILRGRGPIAARVSRDAARRDARPGKVATTSHRDGPLGP